MNLFGLELSCKIYIKRVWFLDASPESFILGSEICSVTKKEGTYIAYIRAIDCCKDLHDQSQTKKLLILPIPANTFLKDILHFTLSKHCSHVKTLYRPSCRNILAEINQIHRIGPA